MSKPARTLKPANAFYKPRRRPPPARPLLPGSAKPKHRKAQATALKQLNVFIGNRFPPPALMIEYFEHRNRNSPQRGKRTHSIFCPNRLTCTNDDTCPKQLAYATLNQYYKLLHGNRIAPAQITIALEDQEVRDYLKQVRTMQNTRIRATRPRPNLTISSYEETVAQLNVSIHTAMLQGRVYDCFLFLQLKFAYISAIATGPRPGELLLALAERTYFSAAPNILLHINIVDRKIAGSQQHLAVPQAQFADQCAHYAFKEYIDFALTHDIPIGPPTTQATMVPWLFPSVVSGRTPSHIHLATDAAGNPLPASLYKLNYLLRKTMATACLTLEQQAFRMQDVRSLRALVLQEETDDHKELNERMGWAPASKMVQLYTKQNQYGTLVRPSPIVTATTVRGADARILQSPF